MRLRESLFSLYTRGMLLFAVIMALCIFQPQHQIYGQPLPNVNVTFNAQVIDVDVFYLGDAAFNLQDLVLSPQSPIFFSMNITSDQSTNILFGIQLTAQTEVGPGEIELFSGITHPIAVEVNQPKFYTSRDLGRGGRLELYRSETIDLSNSSGPAQKFIDVIRATSRVPDGIYTLTLSVYHTQSTTEPYQPRQLLDQISMDMHISNPTRVELFSPMEGDRIFSQFPHFQWRSDTREVMLRVFEMRPGVRSPEEAITGIPHLEQRIDDRNQFTYPQSGPGVRALEPGKRYVWYVEGIYRTSANREETITSELQTFTVIDPGQESTFNILMMELIQLLEEKYPEVIDQIEQGNFEMVEQIYLDGNQITDEQLQMLIRSLRAGLNNEEIISVTIQQ